MAHVPDDTRLVHMNLPGTHDTCTCKSCSRSRYRKEIHGVECELLQGTIPRKPRNLWNDILGRKWNIRSMFLTLFNPRFLEFRTQECIDVNSIQSFKCWMKASVFLIFDMRTTLAWIQSGSIIVGVYILAIVIAPCVLSLDYSSQGVVESHNENGRCLLWIVLLARKSPYGNCPGVNELWTRYRHAKWRFSPGKNL